MTMHNLIQLLNMIITLLASLVIFIELNLNINVTNL